MTIRVKIPEEDWRALNEFVGAQRPFPFGYVVGVLSPDGPGRPPWANTFLLDGRSLDLAE
jgi:hypothetical protein